MPVRDSPGNAADAPKEKGCAPALASSLFSRETFPDEAAADAHMRAVNCFSLTVRALSPLPP